MGVKKTTLAGTVLYGWDNDRIFAEYDDKGDAIQETVYFGSTPVALLKDGKTYRIFSDQIDTPRVITDNTNNTLWVWDSKPFGESQPDEDVDGDNIKLSYNIRSLGQYYDQETGKHYNFNRDYDPATGRYVQSDPIGLDGGMNLYGYALSSPLTNEDLLGKYVTVTVTGGTKVNIVLEIQYTGKVGNTARGMNLTIARLWTGQHGKYDTTVTVKTGTKNTINIINTRYNLSVFPRPPSLVSRVIGTNKGVWNHFDWRGDKPWGWTAAHEAGHLMGLKDRYSTQTGKAYSNGTTNIMGVNNKTDITEDQIWNIISFARSQGTLTER